MHCIHTCIPTFTDNDIVGLGDIGTSTELFHIISKLLKTLMNLIGSCKAISNTVITGNVYTL